MSPESELLIILCRTPLTTAAQNRAIAALAGPLNWENLFHLAEQWEVEPVAFSNLRLRFSEAIPPEVLSRAAVREREARGIALARSLLLAQIVKQLRRSGIRSIVLKGPAVALAAYDDASMRTFSDVDLLVEVHNLTAARESLVATGYTTDYDLAAEPALIRNGHALEFSGPGTKVELHWSLVSRHLRVGFDARELWKESQPARLAGTDISVLAAQHQFLFLCAHGAKHEWERMRWICDVAQLADRLDKTTANAVIGAAARTHTRRILTLALRLVREVFGADASPFLGEAEGRPHDTDRLVAAAMQRLGLSGQASVPSTPWLARVDPRLRPLVFWLQARERRIDRIACLATVLFVPTEKDRGAGALGWLARPLRIVARAVARPPQ
ncbi:MAG: nucleotidyltransferase family protein [Gemmatimonadota bacterium]|nr:nucleotidyltransferase family protein [Gemmatimonadota bacterium]